MLAGLTIEPSALVTFNASSNAAISTTKNVVLQGTLRMRPIATVVHRLTFQGFNEANFVGGGMDPVASDVGLWVMGAGKLDLSGSTKTAWSRLSGAASAGSTSITLESDPVGWRIGDDISIAPTEAPTVGAPSYQAFEDRKVVRIVGRTITLSSSLKRNHPAVANPGPGGGTWRAEVMNLSRNVKISGQDVAHRSHVFIRASVPQTIKNTELRYMGPRKDTNGNGRTERIIGRYPLHFHMMSRAVTYDLGDGTQAPVRKEQVQPGPNSNGSVVDGVVVREAGSHAFVAHESDGVTFKNLVGYNVIETPFWWDDRAPILQRPTRRTRS